MSYISKYPYILKYQPHIDGLRAIAIISVLAFHAFPNIMPGGYIGVDIFFVISGYLISTIILKDLYNKSFSFVDFYGRRIKRIFPTLFIVLVSCYVVGWFLLLSDEYKQLGKHIASGASFTTNFTLLNEVGYFDNLAETKPLLHLWSLAIEEQFYIFWPLILWIFWKLKFNLLIVTLTVTLMSFWLNIKNINVDQIATFYSPQTRMWEVLVGSTLSLIFFYSSNNFLNIFNIQKSSVYKIKFDSLISLIGTCLLIYGFYKINKYTFFPGKAALAPVLGSALIISAGPNAWINKNILSNRILVFIGLISFPLYLWHWPILSIARIVENSEPSLTIRFTAILLAFILSWITYRFVERPIRKSNRNISLIGVLLFLIFLIGCTGYFTYINNGFGFRNQQLELNTEQLGYIFPNNDSCLSRHPYAKFSCYSSDIKYPSSIYIIGDSHMEALTYGFKKLFDNNYLKMNITSIGKGGCNPFLNIESFTDQKMPFGCKNIISSAINDAINDPSVKFIILVGRHAVRISGSGFGDIEKNEKLWTYRYEKNGFISNKSDESFELALEETIHKIIESGKNVIFVHQLPELGFDPRGCLKRTVNSYYNSICGIDRTLVDARLISYKTIVNKLKKSIPNLIEFDPINNICTNTFCSAFTPEGNLLYRDDDHMSKIAAENIARSLIDNVINNQSLQIKSY